MVKIEINGKKMHEISMKLKQDEFGSSHLKYPDHRITFEAEEEEIKILVPLQLALALYDQEIISQDKSKYLNIKINGRSKGMYKVKDLLYPDSLYSQNVKIILKKENE